LFFVGRYTASNRAMTSASALPAKSIAVLPFDNQNRDPNTDYLSDGIPESIINSLSQLPQLRVMARSTVFSYKGKDVDPRKVGHDLGVGAVLMGRLIQQGDNLTIRTELVDVSDGTELWGQQYNRKLADVFAVQEEIAREISENLRLKLTGAERQQLAKRPTENIKAFQYYIQGRGYISRRTREDLLTAIRYFEKAIEEDPNYALAYAGLADAYGTLGFYGYISPIEGRRKEEEAARKALTLDENLAEAHAALGAAYMVFAPCDFSLGDRELRHAIELSPSLALAHSYFGNSLVRQGRIDKGLEEYLKARELDPLSSVIARVQALPYYLKRDYGRAFELLRQANELGPAFTSTWEIGIYIQNKLLDETLAELEKAKGERKNDSILIYDTGMVYAAQGKRAEALQIIKVLEEMSGTNLSQAHWIAKIYATLNEKEEALTWLDRGLATGAIGVFYKDEPVWDRIRSDPRFTDLLRRMGIPQ
jgi:TolB-like protein/Tfp pilus assembly protein PilF